jgi:hypothetical protein
MGGTNLVVPGSGDPTYRTRVYPGIHHVWYTCSHENGCDSSLTEMNYYAYWGIALR